MASGSNVVAVKKVLFPNANAPQPTMRTGGSTPAERIAVYAFDAGTIEYLDFQCELVGYDGGGLTFTLPWSAASATSEATSQLIAYLELSSAVTPNGGNITLAWSASGLFTFTR